MRISKRPTAETMSKEKNGSPGQSPENQKIDSKQPVLSDLPLKREEGAPSNDAQVGQERIVLLVDDNDVNLQLLCAYAQKGGFTYKSAKDGAQAVDLFKAEPGAFQAIVIGVFSKFSPLVPRSVLSSFHYLADHTRYINARNGWLSSITGN
jgi:hypothetical protein